MGKSYRGEDRERHRRRSKRASQRLPGKAGNDLPSYQPEPMIDGLDSDDGANDWSDSDDGE